VDIDFLKLDYLKHNAKIYGVEKKLKVIESSFFDLKAQNFDKIDAVFLSPPWGGVNYN
jgi:trimethylguanosine synthase